MSHLIINPISRHDSEIERSKDLCLDLLAFAMGWTSDWPEASVDELWRASMAVRYYNHERAYGDAMVLWPSKRLIERLHGNWMAGDCGEHVSPGSVCIRTTSSKELYLDTHYKD